MHLASHLCGASARETAAGSDRSLPTNAICFKRVQVNGIELAVPHPLQRVAKARPDLDFILQVRHESFLQEAARLAATMGNCAALYDPSAGRGVEASRWPAPPLGLRMGYAGGIRPDTVDAVLHEISVSRLTSSGDWWVDMESGVRTDDRFDLDKVYTVLNKAKPWIERSKA